MQFTAEDVVIDKSQAIQVLRSRLMLSARYVSMYYRDGMSPELSDDYRVITTGANRIDLSKVVTRDLDEVNSVETVENTARWLISSYAHAQYVADSPHLLYPLLADTARYVDIRHKGITSRWVLDDVLPIVGISTEAVKANLIDGLVVERELQMDNSSFRKFMLMFTDPKLTRDYVGDVSKPMLQRAYYSAKRAQLFGGFYRSATIYDGDASSSFNSSFLRIALPGMTDGAIKFIAYRELFKIINNYLFKPSIYDIQSQRTYVLAEQADQQQRADNVRKQLAQANFHTYWDTMKSRVRAVVPDVATAATQFAQIPLQPQGTPASRTWGIEVETVRAHMTDRPAGWESEYDGSLNGSDGGECNCDCDECYEGDHCDNHSDDCYYNSEGESREFVSPVLNSFNSAGLRKICEDLGDNEDDTSPGIHVHVGANDLTVTDVARLLTAYSAVEPLLVPLYHREVRNYCKEMSSENVQWWLRAARKHLTDTGRIPLPVDLCHNQPADRYQDVNVQALSKHGTIEFRAMGPFYNYDHLVRWAWFVREMVNVSKLGLPQTTWTRCRSLTDVINVLRKYGSEAPLDKQFDNINTAELQLSLSEE